MKPFLFRWLPLLVCMVLIFAVSMDHNPYRALPAAMRQSIQVAQVSMGEVELFGKPGHVVEFALLGAMAARALIWKQRPTVGLFVIPFFASELYALSDEIHQIFVPGRAFDIPDLFIDGAVMGLVDMPEAQRIAMGQAGYLAVTTDYARSNLGRRYSEIFEQVVDAKKEEKK
jgi:VanZ family protein